MDKLLKNYLALSLLALIWGSSFILMKKGLEFFSFVEVATLRIVIAFLALIPFLPRAIKNIKRKHYIPLAITAFLGNGLPAFLFAKAQTEMDSALVGILNSAVPLFTLILGILFFRVTVSKKNIFGIFFGFLGVIILTFNTFHEGVFTINIYVLFVILATIFYAISINVIKYYLYDLDATSIVALAFLIIFPFASIYLFNTKFIYHLQAANLEGYKAFGYIVVLAVIGTSVASIIFNKLLSTSSAIFASSITYLIPIVAIFWGFFDGEIISISHLLGFGIIIIGVYLVNKDLS
ncbi:MAG: EamA family transporter [Flavobacteriales bacterium]|nr:EamA family transporter [Flavobacteriales bacterium]